MRFFAIRLSEVGGRPSKGIEYPFSMGWNESKEFWSRVWAKCWERQKNMFIMLSKLQMMWCFASMIWTVPGNAVLCTKIYLQSLSFALHLTNENWYYMCNLKSVKCQIYRIKMVFLNGSICGFLIAWVDRLTICDIYLSLHTKSLVAFGENAQ